MPLAERLKQFVEIWKILTKDLEILEHVEGYQNTFQQEPRPSKNSRNTSHESRSKTPGTSRNRQHVGEGSHMQNQSFKRGIFLVRKRDGGN